MGTNVRVMCAIVCYFTSAYSSFYRGIGASARDVYRAGAIIAGRWTVSCVMNLFKQRFFDMITVGKNVNDPPTRRNLDRAC